MAGSSWRMRALQLDPVNGARQKWAQNCVFVCTYASLARTLWCFCIPVILGGNAAKGNMVPGVVGTIIRFAVTICL